MRLRLVPKRVVKALERSVLDLRSTRSVDCLSLVVVRVLNCAMRHQIDTYEPISTKESQVHRHEYGTRSKSMIDDISSGAYT